MCVKVVLAIALVAALAALVVMALDSEPDEAVIEYRNDAAPNSETRLLRAERIGRQIWGNVCHGDITVTVAPLKDKMVGRASWWTTQPGENPDPASFYDCAIVVSDKRRFPWRTLCQIMVHEMSHLAGYEHSPNPRSVRYFKGTRHNIPPRCRTT